MYPVPTSWKKTRSPPAGFGAPLIQVAVSHGLLPAVSHVTSAAEAALASASTPTTRTDVHRSEYFISHDLLEPLPTQKKLNCTSTAKRPYASCAGYCLMP